MKEEITKIIYEKSIDTSEGLLIGFKKTKLKCMKWISVNEKLPILDENVLIYYKKGKESIITQGYLTDEAMNLARKKHPAEFWRQHSRGLTWFDSQRQIQSLLAKNSKNKVTHWQPLPKEPC